MPVVQLGRGGRAVGRRISKAFPNGPPGASAPRTMQDWPGKRLHFRGLFISSAVTAWKANPRRPLRHGAAPVPTTSLQSAKARQRDQRMAYRSKKAACALSGIKDGRRRIDFIGGRFRRKSAKIRMHFRFSRAGSASMPTGSRTKARFRRLPYAAVCTVCTSLKRKKTEKRSNSQKRRIKCIRLL